ncbi:substrate-binding domain-containing protein [Lactococcus fujiensis]|uniref:substrate-binding domain-containing protein n=1 Tax=Lactococcus fujiensis TaxID=610251 RepID=UPI000AB89341|nr:substrate-binding domain-containing protein [Lactococcus fujiensis]
MASYITPSLTTVRQNIPEFTKVAVADLIQQIETGKVVQKYIPYEIIVRDSARL